jgi:hypothetical protein
VDGGGNSLVGALTCPNTVTMGTTGNKAELDFTVDGDTSSDQLIGAAGKTLTWNSCKLNITFTATEITAGPHTYNLFTNYTFANGNGAPTVTYVNDAGLACAFNAATGVLTVTK